MLLLLRVRVDPQVVVVESGTQGEENTGAPLETLACYRCCRPRTNNYFVTLLCDIFCVLTSLCFAFCVLRFVLFLRLKPAATRSLLYIIILLFDSSREVSKFLGIVCWKRFDRVRSASPHHQHAATTRTSPRAGASDAQEMPTSFRPSRPC